MKTAILALAALCAACSAQDPTPAVPAPLAPIYVMPTPAPAAPDNTWQWITTYVLVPIMVAAVGVISAWLQGLQGRIERQRQSNEATRDHVVTLAAAIPPTPATTPPPPAAAPPTAGTGGPGAVVVLLLAAVLALGGCAAVGGQIAYTDATGHSYTYASDGKIRVLTLADKNGNAIGLTSDGKEVRLNLKVDGSKIAPKTAPVKASPVFRIAPPELLPLPKKGPLPRGGPPLWVKN